MPTPGVLSTRCRHRSASARSHNAAQPPSLGRRITWVSALGARRRSSPGTSSMKRSASSRRRNVEMATQGGLVSESECYDVQVFRGSRIPTIWLGAGWLPISKRRSGGTRLVPASVVCFCRRERRSATWCRRPSSSGSVRPGAARAGARASSLARPATRTRPSGAHCRAGLSRLPRLPREAARRYEWPCPGDLPAHRQQALHPLQPSRACGHRHS
jgi:hypothetical protein